MRKRQEKVNGFTRQDTRFGLQVDLDWSREDILGAKIGVIRAFIDNCEKKRVEALGALLQVRQ